MSANDFGYGKTWQEVFVGSKEGYSTSVNDYHEHKFYEINLILSGNVRILLRDRFEEGIENRIVLTRPDTPHYVTCNSDTLYSRLYLLFTHEFAAEFLPEWEELSSVFGENGETITLTPSETSFIKTLIEDVDLQKSRLGKRLSTYYLLLKISELKRESEQGGKKPQYLMDAMSYIESNYHKRIVAGDLAKSLYVGRTTLMTEFKHQVGCTLNEYITDCRLKNAVVLLKNGETVERVAEKCGFSDSSGLSRAFKRRYNCAPRRYIKQN